MKLKADNLDAIHLAVHCTASTSESVFSVPVSTADTARDLGVAVDGQLSFKNHVDSVAHSRY